MDGKVEEYLSRNRIAVLSVILPDGDVHGATLHYSSTTNPLVLYFSTEMGSRKTEGMEKGKKGKGAVVIGFSEEEWMTLQMSGDLELAQEDEVASIKSLHYAKHPNSKKFENDPATVFLKFTPTWWRFTDYNTHPMTVISS